MPLIDLKTNLKDLKYGHDQRGGVSSNQPFIATSLPATEDPLPTDYLSKDVLNSLAKSALGIGASVIGTSGGGNASSNSTEIPPVSGTGGPDFLVRGGLLLPTIVSKDAVRMSKFLTSQNGIFFILKQQLLSRVSVRSEYSGIGIQGLLNGGIYNPLSTILGAVGSPFGLHPNKQGLNPLSGLLKDYTPDRYYSYITKDNKEINQSGVSSLIGNNNDLLRNRLIGLYKWKVIANNQGNTLFRENIGGKSRKNDISGNPDFILSYGGGPNSILGIGRTRIPYATDQYNAPLQVKTAYNPFYQDTYGELADASDTTFKFDDEHVKSIIVLNYPTEQQIENRYQLGDPGNDSIIDKGFDYLTAVPIYRTTPANEKTDTGYDDLVDFRIGVINNDDGNIDNIRFRAFLKTFSDNYDTSWNTIKYIGRGENFYTYSGFDRKISLSWTVAAQSKNELIPMYKKLNYLASLTAPDYGASGYMRANIIQLTIGGYLFNQPGLINRIGYEISEDSTWDIGTNTYNEYDGISRQLPHMINVTLEFTPIHNFVPRKQQNSYDQENGYAVGYGNERFISLEDKPNGSIYNADSSLENDYSNYFNYVNTQSPVRPSTAVVSGNDDPTQETAEEKSAREAKEAKKAAKKKQRQENKIARYNARIERQKKEDIYNFGKEQPNRMDRKAAKRQEEINKSIELMQKASYNSQAAEESGDPIEFK